ncbi:MAG: hypothetical protein AAFR61_19440 [Bacteroidota bacterium]
MILSSLHILSSSILGIFLGAQLTEAVLFVPYWKNMTADEFFQFYQRHGQYIHRFFAPLTIAATVLPILTALYHVMYPSDDQWLSFVLAGSSIAFFSTFFLYFKKANQGFTDRSIPDEALPAELSNWGHWHWGRIFFEVIAFGSALSLLLMD